LKCQLLVVKINGSGIVFMISSNSFHSQNISDTKTSLNPFLGFKYW